MKFFSTRFIRNCIFTHPEVTIVTFFFLKNLFKVFKAIIDVIYVIRACGLRQQYHLKCGPPLL